jgi:DedD protein
MDEGAKRRLVGAAVVVALIVIFVPMLLEKPNPDGLGDPIVIPDEPKVEAPAVADELEPLTVENLAPPLPAPEPPTGGSVSAPVVEAPVSGFAQPSGPTSAPPPAQTSSPAASVDLAPSGAAPIPPGTASWVVQVASLGSPDAAKSLQDRLRGEGFTAFVERAMVSGKQYYRVRVGPEIERARADSLAAQLQNLTGNKPLVQRYP